MNEKTYTPSQVADCLGCQLHDLANWRRLAPGHPRRLESVKIDGRHYYTLDSIKEWLHRPENEIYREVVMASFAPPAVREALNPQPQPVGAGLFGVEVAA